MKLWREREIRYCSGCGRKVRPKRAVERGGKIFCRKCFEARFAEDCAEHPGRPATDVCAMCHRLLCEDCVIEVAGKIVCAKCKSLALAKVEAGEEILPLDMSVPPEYRPLQEDLGAKYKVYPEYEKAPFYIRPSVVTVIALMSGAFCIVPFTVATPEELTLRGIIFAICGIVPLVGLYLRRQVTRFFDYDDIMSSAWLTAMTALLIISAMFCYLSAVADIFEINIEAWGP